MNRFLNWMFNISELPEINTKRELYIKLCNDADDILIKSGIRDICIKCSTVKPFRKYYTYKGCCIGCKYITPKGCSTQAIDCKLWLCDDKLEKKIRKVRLWTKWNNIKKIAEKNEWYDGYGTFTGHTRTGISDYPELGE